jgi:DNA-directed RNA polymerase subunit beta'
VTKFYIGQKTGNLLRRVREDKDGKIFSQYVRTTPGRIIFNKTVQDALA